jgi:acetylornithine deacetylase
MFAVEQSEGSLARQWLNALCAVESTSGQEQALLPVVQDCLRQLGAEVAFQEVAAGRQNVLAVWGQPRLLFTTHLDTVPPYFPPRWSGDRLQARGACDAKGQIVAQWLAVRRLRQVRTAGLAWLGVVGEETDSLGASAAAAHADWRHRLSGCRAIVNGEPTQSRLATGQRGTEVYRVACRGRSAHSGVPEAGRSALWMLFEWLAALRRESGVCDPVFGPEVWNFGLCRGGEAVNSVPAFAEGHLHFRTVPGGRLPDRLRELRPEGATVEVLLTEPATRFTVVPGFEAGPVPFGSDAPTLARLVPGAAMLQIGPGSIQLAHTPDEALELSDLLAGVDVLERIGAWFLACPDALREEGTPS